MTYRAFQDLVERLWEEIPEDFKRGLQGVHVFPEARPEPGLEGVWRLGGAPGPGAAFGLLGRSFHPVCISDEGWTS